MSEILGAVFRNSAAFCSVSIVQQIIIHTNYIDPGTGSLVLQIVIGSLVGALFLLKVFWRKLTSFFHGLFLKNKKGQ